MDVMLFFCLFIVQAIIMGFIAQRRLRQVGAGIFYGVVAAVLTGFMLYLFEITQKRTVLLLADGPYTSGGAGFIHLFIALGISSIIIMVILSILAKPKG